MKNNKSQKLAILGGILASLVASTCCIGPVIFALLGISSAGLSKFEAIRTYTTAATIFFLVFAFYKTYKKKPSVQCENGSYCENPKSNKINRIILWISTIIILGVLTFPWWSIYLF